MKKHLLILLLSTLLFTSVHAQDLDEANCCPVESCVEENNFYAKIFSGANYLQDTQGRHSRDEQHTGYILSGSLGYRLSSSLRLEAEYAVRRNFFVRDGYRYSIAYMYKSSSLMGNMLWDLPLSQFIDSCKTQAFIGGGVGFDYRNFKKGYFSWQILSGLTYPLFSNTDISLEYRFHKGVGRRYYTKNLYNHSLGLGLTYKFGSRFKL